MYKAVSVLSQKISRLQFEDKLPYIDEAGMKRGGEKLLYFFKNFFHLFCITNTSPIYQILRNIQPLPSRICTESNYIKTAHKNSQ